MRTAGEFRVEIFLVTQSKVIYNRFLFIAYHTPEMICTREVREKRRALERMAIIYFYLRNSFIMTIIKEMHKNFFFKPINVFQAIFTKEMLIKGLFF